jgi:ATP-dependent RNA helicase RhlE
MHYSDLDFNSLLVRNLAAMGYLRPRPIQALAAGPIRAGRDLIGLARTGTGKTAAFAAPVADRLLADRPPRQRGARRGQRAPLDAASRLRALILCPTRELARQVADETAAIVKGSVLRVLCAYGKVGLRPQVEALAAGVDILVATPGRVRELLEAGALALAYVKHVVIDEADRMLDMGFLPQVRTILEQIGAERQTMLFTATMPDQVASLATQLMRDPLRIEAEPHTRPAPHITHRAVSVQDRDKVPALIELLAKRPAGGALVFCRTRRRVGWVGAALHRHAHGVGMVHGDRTQAQRLKALQRFAAGELGVLVATDVAARGLHIPAVRTVINYDLPADPEEYVHRVGRAGHGGSGPAEAINFVAADERPQWHAMMTTLELRVPVEAGATAAAGHARSSDRKTPQKPGKRRAEGFAKPARPEQSRQAGRKQGPSQRRKKPQRSRKGRPIGKDQAPGRGVVRLQSR